MILFGGQVLHLRLMLLGVCVLDDLVTWENHRLPDDMPLYDYAPDVRVQGDYVYFCASSRDHICDRYRTKDILHGPYEKIPGTFSYWDLNLFFDDDGRVYFYWGCTNTDPIWGVELDLDTFAPVGEDGSRMPRGENEIDAMVEGFLKSQGVTADQIPKALLSMIRGMFTNQPYIEGAWMTSTREPAPAPSTTSMRTTSMSASIRWDPLPSQETTPIPISRADSCQEQDTAPRWRTGAEISGTPRRCASA